MTCLDYHWPGSDKSVRIDIITNPYHGTYFPGSLRSTFWLLLFIRITFPGLTAYSFSVRRDHWSPSKIGQQPEIVSIHSLLIVIDPAELPTTAWTNSGHNMIVVLKKLNRFCSKIYLGSYLQFASNLRIPLYSLSSRNWSFQSLKKQLREHFFHPFVFTECISSLIHLPTVLLQFVFFPQNCRPMPRLHLKIISTIYKEYKNQT